METQLETPRQRLLESVRGRSLRIPDLQAFLSNWPQYVNSELDRLREDVDERLQKCVVPSRLHRKRLLAHLGTVKPLSRRSKAPQDEGSRCCPIWCLLVAVRFIRLSENRHLPVNLGASASLFPVTMIHQTMLLTVT